MMMMNGTGRLNIHETYVTTNKASNDIAMFLFCFTFDNDLDKRVKNIVGFYLIGYKINQNCLKIDATH